MVELTKTQKIVIGVSIICILIVVGIFLYRQSKQPDYSILNFEVAQEEQEEKTEEKETQKIVIHVTGYVNIEGIVELEKGARIADAIEAAGGETSDADLGKINLAYKLKDGQKIYIPSILDEEGENEYITEESGDNVIADTQIKDLEGEDEMININTATQTELETLTGIGPSTASKIIEYREQNGEFQSIEEIQNVSGIGEAKYESIKNNICV